MSSGFLTTYIIISWIFGFLGIVAVLFRPGKLFPADGWSKGRWLLIEVAGAVLTFTGIFTWAAYWFLGRPGVKRERTRRSRWSLFWGTFFREGGRSIRESNDRYLRTRVAAPPPPPTQLGWFSDRAGTYDVPGHGTLHWDGMKWTRPDV
jgi:hypothetical protein